MANPYPINPLLKYIVKLWMTIFTWYYKISANISTELRDIDEPYLLLSNHYGRYDPFIISNFIKKRPNFISSDAILRDRIIGTLFKGLGAMPKKKGVRDSHIIREMIKVVRSGGSLALFPEATRTWSGETLFIDPSIAKLVKLLRVPVICARMKGAYFFDPRWANRIRQSEFEIDYNLLIPSEEIAGLTEESIYEKIHTGLYQDDNVYQLERRSRIRSNKRAEHIELILFQCPKCESYEGFSSEGNSFSCNKCNKTALVNKFGFLESIKGEKIEFGTIKDWFSWQNNNFVKFVQTKIDEFSNEPLLYADNMEIQYAVGEGRMQKAGIGKVYLYLDRLQIISVGLKEELLFTDIDTLGPQFNERLELFYKDRAYRFTSISHKEPGVKWELAANVIWANSGSINKLSPYFKDLVQSTT